MIGRKKIIHTIFMMLYSYVIMYFLKFQNNNYLIWFVFVPLFYFMYISRQQNENIKLELFMFSLIQIIMFLNGLFVVKSVIYVTTYILFALIMGSFLYISYLTIEINFYLPAVIWVLFEKFLIDFLPFYSISFYVLNGKYLKQFASVFGNIGITFVIILVNLALTKFIIKKNNYKEILAIILIIFVILTYGYFYIDYQKGTENNIKKVAVLQTSLKNEDKEYYFNGPLEIKEYLNFIKEMIPQEDVDIIAMPEVSLWEDTLNKTYDVFESDLDLIGKNFPEISQNKQSDLIFGVKSTTENINKELENYLLYYDYKKEKYMHRYDKRLLVPKYESTFKYYFKNYFNKNKENDFKYKTLICYEGLFEHLYWDNLENKSLIFLLSNNHMLQKNKLPDEMLKYYTFRAIMFNRNMIIADNWGYSAIIDRNGKVKKIKKYNQNVLMGSVNETLKSSYYYQYGHWFWLVSALFLLIILIKEEKK